MTRKSRNIALGVGLILLSTFLVCWPPLFRFLLLSGLQEARKNGAKITWEGLSTSALSASLSSLKLLVPGPAAKGSIRIPVTLELAQLDVRLSPLSLVKFSPLLIYTTQAYGGRVSGALLPGTSTLRLTSDLNGVELGQHPQLSSLGIRGGRIDGHIRHLLVRRNRPEGGEFSLSVQDLQPPTNPMWSSLMKVDDLGLLSLKAEGLFEPNGCRVRSFSLSSSFGTIEGDAQLEGDITRSPSLSGRASVKLSDMGAEKFGAWLPVLLGGGVDANTRSFTITAAPVPCSRSSGERVIRLGEGCVRLVIAKA